MNRLMLQIVGAFCFGGVAAGSAIAQTADQPPIRIGVLGTFSGPLSTATVTAQKGVDFAVEEFNRKGGLNGRKVELVIRDTGGEPTKAVNFAQQLISSERVLAIIGPANSGEALATVPIVSRAGVLNVVQGVLDVLIDPVKYPYAFRISNTNTQWIERANDYLLNQLKKKKIAVIGDTSGYGVATVKQVSQMLEASGAPAAYTAVIDPNKTDVTDEIAKARAAGADAVSIWSGSTGLVARLLNARAEQSWDAPFIGHPAIMALPVRDLLAKPENWKNAYSVGFTNPTYDSNGKLSPDTQKLLDAMRPRLGGTELNFTLWWVLLGYDSVNLILHGIEEAKSTDPAAIKKVLETTPYKGEYTTYSYSSTNHNGFPDSGLTINLADSFRDGSFSAAPLSK